MIVESIRPLVRAVVPKPLRTWLRRVPKRIRSAFASVKSALRWMRARWWSARSRLARLRYSPYLRPLHPGIRPLRTWEITALAEREPYYKTRVGYLTKAAGIADELIKRDGLRTGLELGPNIRPLLLGADVMDWTSLPGLELEGRLIIHDATVTPWPVADDAYDLFVALQVFEHLGTGQPAAFREVARVARHAILSLPIDWVLQDTSNLHHGLTHERVLSWFAPWTPTRVVEGNPGKFKRLLYVFENLRDA